MVVSLYVCDIPKSVNKKEIEEVFSEFQGYIETRMKVFQDKGKICFVDYNKETDANFVIHTLQGFKFSSEDKGIHIKISDNTKQSLGGNSKSQESKEKKKHRSDSRSESRSKSPSRSRSRSRSISVSKDKRGRRKRSRSVSHSKKNSRSMPAKETYPTNYYNSDNFKNNASGSGPTNYPIEQLPSNPNSSLLSLLGTLTGSQQIQPLPQIDNNPIMSLLTSFAGNQIQQNNPYDQISNLLTSFQNVNSNPSYPPERPQSDLKSKFNRFNEKFQNFTHFEKKATNIVFIEGLPSNATEREVAHILRPFPGYMSSRLIVREKNGKKTVMCFSDFENVYQATLCIHTLQGYRFDKSELVGLHFSYGVSKQKK